MPQKLQIKLLSNSGELLNVVSCFSGQTSVLRASSPSELKPYQRALAGIQGPEKFSISIDGEEYRPADHNLIGFGERLQFDDITVSALLEQAGFQTHTVEPFLLSFGLDGTASKRCKDLSEDEVRRLRLIAATYSPERVLILNEPFEPIASQWRERFAELLSNFARSKSGLVVVTSTSYRPECWIDNDTVARIQVGQNLQRTIGFGAAGSDTTNLMNQVRDFAREEAKKEQHRETTIAAAAAAATASPSLSKETFTPPKSVVPQAAKGSSFLAITPTQILLAVALGLTGYVAITDSKHTPQTIIMVKQDPPNPPGPPSNPPNNTVPIGTGPDDHAAQNVPHTEPPPPPPAVPEFILDLYPEPIRVSLLDTVNGTFEGIDQATQDVASQPSPPQ